MLRVVADPPPPLGSLNGDVPGPPPRFRPRPDDLTRIAAETLVDLERPVTVTGPERATIVHGMGGAGKSVLAAAFVRGWCLKIDTTYEIALSILFLDKLGEAKDRELIQKLALRLIAGQGPTGGWRRSRGRARCWSGSTT